MNERTSWLSGWLRKPQDEDGLPWFVKGVIALQIVALVLFTCAFVCFSIAAKKYLDEQRELSGQTPLGAEHQEAPSSADQSTQE